MKERFEEILAFALLNNASDIHFEIDKYSKDIDVSLRTITGFKRLDAHHEDKKVIEHLKYVGNLNLMDEEKPQSGAFTYFYNNEEIFFRVASIKSHYLEVCVLRILNKLYIDSKIFKPINAEVNSIMKKNSGLIIFSGPTGSGKTTSLYTLINMYKDKKIYSIEDPIEIYFKNIVQVDVNRKKNFGYREAISQVLRHDPDIICIGEIRDEEAAKMAIRAAYTGHLVICTVHATDCLRTIERLKDLGVSSREIEDNVIFIANQRLQTIGDLRESTYETLLY